LPRPKSRWSYDAEIPWLYRERKKMAKHHFYSEACVAWNRIPAVA
jgi:hypothetical protein